MLEITSVLPTGKTNDTGGRPKAKASDGTKTQGASDENFDSEYGASEQKPAEASHAQEKSDKLKNNSAMALNEKDAAQGTFEQTENSPEPRAKKVGTAVLTDDFTTSKKIRDAALEAIPPETDEQIAPAGQSLVASERTRELSSKRDIVENKGIAAASVPVPSAQASTSENATSAKEKNASRSAASPAENIISAKTLGANDGLPLPGQGISKPAETSVPPPDAGKPKEVDSLKQAARTVSRKEIEEKEVQFTAKETKVTKPSPPYDKSLPTSPIKPQPASNLPSVPVSVNPLAKTSTALLNQKFDTSLNSESEANLSLFWEPRTAGTGSIGTLQQLLSRPGTPLMIGRQMAEALQKLPDRPVELSLNPSELGRVRMSISAGEAGITVSVLTERPETMDLLRRNISDLEQEFQAIGYEDINFTFSEGNSREALGGDSKSATHVSVIELEPEEETAIASTSSAVASGLDLRL